MHRTLAFCTLLSLFVLPAAAQNDNAALLQAQQMLANAEAAGARTLATSLYDDAAYRLHFAGDNWNVSKAQSREQARMRAREALFAARAALSKSRWLSTNMAIRALQTDIRGFGGSADVAMLNEDAQIDFHRGTTTANRIATAQSAVEAAKAIGAESLRDSELATAQQNIDSARKVSMNGKKDSDVADHLAYIAEMIGRSAYYVVRGNEANRYVPDLQLQRTRLAQTASERQAALERQQREEAERRTLELQKQLAAEQQNRQMQQAELDKLHQQVEETRRAQLQRTESDRQARVVAEQRLDDLIRQYQAAISGGAPTADIENLRRQIEDQQIALQTIRQREQFGESALESEIGRLRAELDASRTTGTISAQVLQERQADLVARQTELESLKKERQADIARRAEIDQRNAAAIAEAQQKRQEAEAQAAQLKAQAEQAAKQVEAAQQQLQAVQQQAQQQVQQSQQQAQAAETARQESAQQAEAAKQQVEAERQKAALAQTELEQTKRQLAASDAEAHRLRLQQSLAQFAPTRTDPRGVIVTLPALMFDPGKSALKSGAKSTLKNIANQLKNESTLVITVEGHTDNSGGKEKNLKLSEARAKVVREHLIANGISGDHITAIGKGEADPVASNKTTAGRQQNRRVELILAQ